MPARAKIPEGPPSTAAVSLTSADAPSRVPASSCRPCATPRRTRRARSHKLLVRGGYIRQMSAGLWTYLPLGWKTHENVVRIVGKMDAIGCQEMSAPVLTPAELWEQTGRYGIAELFKLEDRAGRRFVLPADARGVVHLPCARAAELPAAAADALPLPDEGPRRAPPARRPAFASASS